MSDNDLFKQIFDDLSKDIDNSNKEINKQVENTASLKFEHFDEEKLNKQLDKESKKGKTKRDFQRKKLKDIDRFDEKDIFSPKSNVSKLNNTDKPSKFSRFKNVFGKN